MRFRRLADAGLLLCIAVAATGLNANPPVQVASARQDLRPDGSQFEKLLLLAADAGPNAEVRFAVVLESSMLYDMDLSTEDKADRAALKEVLGAANADVLMRTQAELASRGCRDFHTLPAYAFMWVTCPTETVPFVIGLADVLDVGAVTDGAVTTEYGYDGLKRRNEAGVSTLIGGGFDGNHGSRTDGTLPVLISFIDTSPFHDHAGYCETSSPCALGDGNGDGLADHINKRHLRNMTCTSSACTENTCTPGSPQFCYTIESSPTHIDTILNVAVASIEQGQAPAIPGTNDRIARSGASKEAEFYVYYATGSTTLARAEAVAEAIDDSDTTADIISLSLGFFPDQCDPTDDMAGLRALLPLVTNMGVLFVVAVGNQENESNTTACTVDSTMGRPGLLSVGAVDSSNSSASLSQLVRAN